MLCLFLFLASILPGVAAEPAQPPGPLLTNALQVRALTVDQARRSLPVRIRGVITYTDPAWDMLFVQDSSGGVFVNSSDLRAELSVGQSVEVIGVSRPGAFSPVIHRAHLELLGPKGLPTPRTIGFAEMLGGKADADWVEFRGRVGSALITAGHLVLRIEQDGNWMRACLPSIPDRSQDLVNARVRLQGVCAVSADQNRHIIGAQLFVPSHAQVVVEEAAPPDPFALPIRTIAEALKPGAPPGVPPPVRIRAAVQTNGIDGLIWLRDRTGMVRLDTARTNDLRPGHLLDVVGIPDWTGGNSRFKETALRCVGVVATNEAWWDSDLLLGATKAGTNVLTSISQVRALKPEQASQNLPVQVHCVVTYRDEDWGVIFVQAASGGIYVDVDRHQLDLHVGDWIELQAVTTPGEYAPSLARPRFQPLGRAPLPAARTYTLRDLSSGSQDSQWVRMEGIVHSLTMESTHATLTVAEPGGNFEVSIPNLGNQPAPTNLVDAKIRAEGVCATIFNQKRQLVGIRVNAPSLDFIKAEQHAPGDPFSLPLRSIDSLLQFTADERPDHRVRIRGTVTLHRPGEFAFIQDDTGGVMVTGEALGAIKSGDQVEAIGFPAAGSCTPILIHAICRRIGSGTQPVAAAMTAEQVLGEGSRKEFFDSRLVRLQGRLLDLTSRSKEKLLVLQNGSAIFNSCLQSSDPLSPVLRVGSMLEVTGVCSVQVDANRNPKAFQLYLRSPADIQILQSGPWWTLRHTLAVVGLMSALVLGAVAWVMALRRRVSTQTEQIKQRLEREQMLEARYRELFENNPHPMWVYDRETLAFLAVNEAAVRHYGYSRQEFLRMTIKGIRPASELDSLAKHL